jgi:hypothetical protein
MPNAKAAPKKVAGIKRYALRVQRSVDIGIY